MINAILWKRHICLSIISMQRVQGKVKFKINDQHCEECNVEKMTYPHLEFLVCLNSGVCGDDIFTKRYDESMVMHKKRKCIYNNFSRKLESSYVENLLRSLIE